MSAIFTRFFVFQRIAEKVLIGLKKKLLVIFKNQFSN